GAADRNAEFVLGFAGRDLGMRLWIDIRIDAHRNVGGMAFGDGDRGQKLKLGFGFDIDAEDAVLDREVEFTSSLADARENDPLRLNASGARAKKVAFGHKHGGGAKPSERGDDRLVGIRLQRVTNKRIDIGEGGGEDI